MEELTAMVVDDEPAARRDLEQVLGEVGGVRVVARAGDAETARQQARKHLPQLIFMDIHLPGADGFKALEEIDTARACVIFTTAYSQFALRAFEVGATDYLLKPVEEERCRRAVERARETLQRAAQAPGETQIEIEERGAHLLVPAASVEVVTAYGNYLEVRHRGGVGLTRQTLEGLLEKLAPEPFLRVSRKQAARLSFIAGYKGNGHRGIKLVLRDGQELPSSRRRSPEVLAALRAAAVEPAASA